MKDFKCKGRKLLLLILFIKGCGNWSLIYASITVTVCESLWIMVSAKQTHHCNAIVKRSVMSCWAMHCHRYRFPHNPPHRWFAPRFFATFLQGSGTMLVDRCSKVRSDLYASVAPLVWPGGCLFVFHTLWHLYVQTSTTTSFRNPAASQGACNLCISVLCSWISAMLPRTKDQNQDKDPILTPNLILTWS